MGSWLSPPQIARDRGVKPAKVLAWIASGELAAVNHAESALGRPRWRVSREALEAFDRVRSNRAGQLPAGSTASRRRGRRSNPEVIEFF